MLHKNFLIISLALFSSSCLKDIEKEYINEIYTQRVIYMDSLHLGEYLKEKSNFKMFLEVDILFENTSDHDVFLTSKTRDQDFKLVFNNKKIDIVPIHKFENLKISPKESVVGHYFCDLGLTLPQYRDTTFEGEFSRSYITDHKRNLIVPKNTDYFIQFRHSFLTYPNGLRKNIYVD